MTWKNVIMIYETELPTDFVLLFRMQEEFGIEFVEQYKYLGTDLNNDLKFDANSGAVCKKRPQHLYFQGS